MQGDQQPLLSNNPKEMVSSRTQLDELLQKLDTDTDDIQSLQQVQEIMSRSPDLNEVYKDRLEKLYRKHLAINQVNFLTDFAEENPQQNSRGEIEYVFVGSLAFAPLSAASEAAILDTDSDVAHPKYTIQLDDRLREQMSTLVRKTGDLDIARTKHREIKGNGPPRISIDKVPDGIFKYPNSGEFLSADVVNGGGWVKAKPIAEVAKVTIGNQELFVTPPIDLLAYKLVNALETFPDPPENKSVDLISNEAKALRTITENFYAGMPLDINSELQKRILSYFDTTREAFLDMLNAGTDSDRYTQMPEEFRDYFREIMQHNDTK